MRTTENFYHAPLPRMTNRTSLREHRDCKVRTAFQTPRWRYTILSPFQRGRPHRVQRALHQILGKVPLHEREAVFIPSVDVRPLVARRFKRGDSVLDFVE